MKPIAILAVVLSLACAACGNKGPLILPGPPPAEEAPPESPESIPPTPEGLNDADQVPPEGAGTDAGTPPPGTPTPR